MPGNRSRSGVATADLLAALERLGGEATTTEIAAEATGGPVGASLRSSVHLQLRDISEVREGSQGPAGRRRSVWRLRTGANT